MLDVLPAVIDPLRLADEGVRLCGRLNIKGMRRLTEMCADDQGIATVDLQFERSAQGLRRVHGTIDADLRVICQRCMQPFWLKVETDTGLLVVVSGESAMADEVDVLEAKPLPLSQLVEDELLLALPMIPAHQPATCQAVFPKIPAEERAERNPFATLGKLKRDK